MPSLQFINPTYTNDSKAYWVLRTMIHTPPQDEYQVDLSRCDRPRRGKPILANIPLQGYMSGDLIPLAPSISARCRVIYRWSERGQIERCN